MITDYKDFKVTPEMKKAVELVMIAQAQADTIRPIVREYQGRALEVIRQEDGKIENVFSDGEIKTSEDTWKMNEAQFEKYLEKVERARVKAGLHIRRAGNCPLLEAESDIVEAKHALVATMEPVTDVKSKDLFKPGHMEKFTDLSIKLVVSASDINPGALLSRMARS